jgi:hypothetical protein
MEQSPELCREKCLVGFLHASHSFFRYRSRFVPPNDDLLEHVEIRLIHHLATPALAQVDLFL